MANVLYDKTDRLPSAKHSLKRALLQTVWLRRQEMRVKETEVLVMGLADAAEGKGPNRISKAWKSYIDSAYPFASKVRSAQDEKMVQMMKKEADAGPIAFSTVQYQNPLLKAAERVNVPDDFLQKLRNRKKTA